MQNMDGTIVATALPSMARDLGVDPVHLSSAITAYLVALTVFIPASGWVADRFGARRVFMWAIATFTLASVACAASTSLSTLIAARIVQGLGGAMMVPVGRLILFRGVKREELLQATTWLTMPALIGPLLGPPLGGFLTDTLSWRSIFWVNVPVGIVGLLLTWRLLPPSHAEHPRPPDVRGMLLVGVSLTLFMIGIESAGRGVLPDGLPWLFVASGALLFWLAVRHCRRVDHPAVDFSLLAIPTFHAATIAGSLFRAGAGALPLSRPADATGGLRLQRVGKRPHHVRERARLVLHAADDIARAAPLLRADGVMHGQPIFRDRAGDLLDDVASVARRRHFPVAAARRLEPLALVRDDGRARLRRRAAPEARRRDLVSGHGAAVDEGVSA